MGDLLIVVLAIGAIGVNWALIAARFPSASMVLTVASLVVAEAGVVTPSFAVGSVSIYVDDAIIVLTLWQLAFHVAQRSSRLRQIPASLAVLTLLIAASLLVGISRFGMATALNGARPWLGFLAAAAYSAVVFRRREVSSPWVVAGCALAALALLRVSRYGVGQADIPGSRALTALAALVIAVAAIWSLVHPPAWAPRWLPWPLLAIVIVLQHRSVWLATAGMLLVAVTTTKARSKTIRRIAATVPVLVVALVLLIAVTPIENGVLASLETSATETQDERSTWRWRAEGWVELAPRSIGEWITGRPLGSEYTRTVFGIVRTETPHNAFVGSLLAAGLVAAIAMLRLFWLVWRRAGDPAAKVAAAGLATYFMAYGVAPTAGLLLGTLLAITPVGRTAPAKRAPAAATPLTPAS